MHFTLLLVVAVAPSIIGTGYLFYRDRQRSAPKRMIVRTFLVGLLVTAPALSLELILSQGQKMLDLSIISGLFVKSFAIVAFSEEFFKLAVVIFVVYNKEQFSQCIDGMRYAVLAALGFAAMENFLYGLLGGIGLAVWRYFTALPMHILTAGIMGYYIGLAKKAESHHEENKNIIIGFLYAVSIHGIYDFMLFATGQEKVLTSIGIILIFFASVIVFQSKYKLAAQARLDMANLS